MASIYPYGGIDLLNKIISGNLNTYMYAIIYKNVLTLDKETTLLDLQELTHPEYTRKEILPSDWTISQQNIDGNGLIGFNKEWNFTTTTSPEGLVGYALIIDEDGTDKLIWAGENDYFVNNATSFVFAAAGGKATFTFSQTLQDV